MGSKQVLIAYLLALAAAVSVGSADAEAGLRRLETETIVQLLDDVDSDDFDHAGGEATQKDRRTLLALLAKDPRAMVRVRVAARARETASSSAEMFSLIRQLTSDPSRDVRAVAMRSLGAFLEGLSPLLRIEHLAECCFSSWPREREAILVALRSPLTIVGSEVAIEHLSSDPDPQVRLEALATASYRRRELAGDYLRIVTGLIDDSDVRVRERAQSLRQMVS